MVKGMRNPIRCLGRGPLVVLAVALLMMSAACGDRNVYVPPPPPKVTVSQPVSRPVTDYLEFTGNTAAINTVQLRARVEGYLEKVLFRDGELVKKGKALFLIQRDTYEAKLKQAEAEILANKARLMHAQTEFTRFSRLVSQKAAAQTDVDRWHYERDAAQAAVTASEAQRELAKLNVSYTEVKAPFDGRVGRRLKDPGNLVGAGESTVLTEINQINPIYVYFNINEQDLLRVRGETPEPEKNAHEVKWPVYFGLADDKGYPHHGYLDFAAITINPSTGTLLLRGIFPNSKALILPGMFTRVRVPAAEARPALLIPEVAIGYDQQGPYVMLVDDQKVVGRRPVQLGNQVDDYRVITAGLQGPEWVVVSGLLRAIPGRPVTPEKAAPPGSAAPQAPKAPPTEPRKTAP
ncbi:MAG: efflux transporter periplasmic adaptor subunit [Desulfobacca sp. RBG_16_58_9]|nr:MAG: efflux transporter periplasmic adaptor subunit [Desulfobacca sp. RBG_16_58_9]